MTPVTGSTPEGRGERTLQVSYERGEDEPRLHLWIQVGNSSGTQVRVRVGELLAAILREVGVE
jgi:hypothetical protein